MEPCPINVKIRPWLSAENLVLVLTEIVHLTPDHGPKPRWLARACKNGMHLRPRKCDTGIVTCSPCPTLLGLAHARDRTPVLAAELLSSVLGGRTYVSCALQQCDPSRVGAGSRQPLRLVPSYSDATAKVQAACTAEARMAWRFAAIFSFSLDRFSSILHCRSAAAAAL